MAGSGDDPLILAGREFHSRLLVGTGKYRDAATAQAAIEASGAEIVTVAVRRAIADGKPALEEILPRDRYTYLPNSASCRTAEEAVRLLRLGRELSGHALVKLEVVRDFGTLLPDEDETLKAAQILAREGFAVMAYTGGDPGAAKRLEEAGCAAVMPLASPIGTGQGILNPEGIRAIARAARVPVLVDAGIGTASDTALAMELGCAGVLLNTAIAAAKDPVAMARAMKHAMIAGRLAYLAGRMQKREHARASSPMTGTI